MTSTTWRGTTNRNDRGNTTQRRARREYLVETYRADRDAHPLADDIGGQFPPAPTWIIGVPRGMGLPACRCYRCGELLTVNTVTANRIVPGCLGGTYRRSNIRPACGPCNSSTGGALGNARKRQPAGAS